MYKTQYWDIFVTRLVTCVICCCDCESNSVHR